MATSKRENKLPIDIHSYTSHTHSWNLYFCFAFSCGTDVGMAPIRVSLCAPEVFEEIALEILKTTRTRKHIRIPWFIHFTVKRNEIKWNEIMVNLIWIHSREDIRSWINELKERSNGWMLNAPHHTNHIHFTFHTHNAHKKVYTTDENGLHLRFKIVYTMYGIANKHIHTQRHTLHNRGEKKVMLQRILKMYMRHTHAHISHRPIVCAVQHIYDNTFHRI